MVKENQLEEKVLFVQRQTPELLKSYTYYAELGLTMDKDTNLNYRYSLPNKIFDYIQAGIPVLASDLPEVKKIVLDNNVGMICESHDTMKIAHCINTMLQEDYKSKLKEDIENARRSLNWESQEYIIKQVYQKYL